MKKVIATLCVVSTALLLGACAANNSDMGRGYASETAGSSSSAVATERTFRSTQSK